MRKINGQQHERSSEILFPVSDDLHRGERVVHLICFLRKSV
ncbi:hypothetical protein [Neisseria sicca]|nr:hypothetical protein [Neisseria sicca]